VNSVEEAEGRVIRNENPYVKVLATPHLVDGKWTALAQVDGMLAIIELKVTQHETIPKEDERDKV